MPAPLPPVPAVDLSGELQDLLAAEAQLFDAKLPRDVDEVVNCVRAMDYGLERLAELPVSVRLIREIHT